MRELGLQEAEGTEYMLSISPQHDATCVHHVGSRSIDIHAAVCGWAATLIVTIICSSSLHCLLQCIQNLQGHVAAARQNNGRHDLPLQPVQTEAKIYC